MKRGESGPANIFDAAAVAVSPDARERGVLIVMHGDIHSARRVTKIDTSAVDAFESVMPPDLGTVRSGLVAFSQAGEIRNIEGKNATALRGGSQQLGFVAGIQGHPWAGRACDIMATLGKSSVKLSARRVCVQV